MSEVEFSLAANISIGRKGGLDALLEVFGVHDVDEYCMGVWSRSRKGQGGQLLSLEQDEGPGGLVHVKGGGHSPGRA